MAGPVCEIVNFCKSGASYQNVPGRLMLLARAAQNSEDNVYGILVHVLRSRPIRIIRLAGGYLLVEANWTYHRPVSSDLAIMRYG